MGSSFSESVLNIVRIGTRTQGNPGNIFTEWELPKSKSIFRIKRRKGNETNPRFLLYTARQVLRVPSDTDKWLQVRGAWISVDKFPTVVVVTQFDIMKKGNVVEYVVPSTGVKVEAQYQDFIKSYTRIHPQPKSIQECLLIEKRGGRS